MGIPLAETAVVPQAVTCPACRQVFKSQMAFYGHRRTCKHQPERPLALLNFSSRFGPMTLPMSMPVEPVQLSQPASSSASQPAAPHRGNEAQPEPLSQPVQQAQQLGWFGHLDNRLANIEAQLARPVQMSAPIQPEPVQLPQKGLWGWMQNLSGAEKLALALVVGFAIVQIVKYTSRGSDGGGRSGGKGLMAELGGYAGKKLVDQFLKA